MPRSKRAAYRRHRRPSSTAARAPSILQICATTREHFFEPAGRRFESVRAHHQQIRESLPCATGQLAPADETFEITIVKNNAALNGFNQWTLNGEAFSVQTMKPLMTVHEGRRYRLKFRNASDDIHPLHLHRHSFELAQIRGRATGGVVKDVVMLGGIQELALDFVADNPGPTLFHCHQQLHKDFGFMALFKYA
jgi:FtsP/CotA-like multicopper oxidase with cupredoxin domain